MSRLGNRLSNRISPKRKRFLREKFEELQEYASNPHMKGDIVNDTQREVEKYLKEFLKAGFNATRVSGLLSCENRLKHRQLLIEYKARINITANIQRVNRDYLKKNWDKLIKLKNVTADLLTKAFIGDNPIIPINDLNFLIQKGASKNVLFSRTIELEESLEEIEEIKEKSPE